MYAPNENSLQQKKEKFYEQTELYIDCFISTGRSPLQNRKSTLDSYDCRFKNTKFSKDKEWGSDHHVSKTRALAPLNQFKTDHTYNERANSN